MHGWVPGPWDRDQSWRQRLNSMSHPGAPGEGFLFEIMQLSYFFPSRFACWFRLPCSHDYCDVLEVIFLSLIPSLEFPCMEGPSFPHPFIYQILVFVAVATCKISQSRILHEEDLLRCSSPSRGCGNPRAGCCGLLESPLLPCLTSQPYGRWGPIQRRPFCSRHFSSFSLGPGSL